MSKSKRSLPEVSDIITDLLSGRMTQEEWDDLAATDCPEDSDSYQWWEGDTQHRKWNNGVRQYRSEKTQWKWQPYTG